MCCVDGQAFADELLRGVGPDLQRRLQALADEPGYPER